MTPFIARQLWLKKDLILVERKGGNFNDENAVIQLGVGKKYGFHLFDFGLKAFIIIDQKRKCKLTLGKDYLDDENGVMTAFLRTTS